MRRSEFVALVAVACTVLIFVIGLTAGAHFWPGQSLDQPVEQPHATAAEYYQEQRGPSEGYWWPEFATRDTYAQWAMTILAAVATAASIVGIILLRRTFEETKRTAEAAEASNALARVSFESGFRPWLLVTISGRLIPQESLNMFREGDPPTRNINMRAKIEVTNYGDMPATILSSDTGVVGAVAGIKIDRPPKWEMFEVLTKEQVFNPLQFPARDEDGAGSVGIFNLTAETRDEFMMLRPPIVGVIDYLDALGKPRKLGFAFQPTAMGGSDYKRWGGEEYNYDREIAE